MDNRDDRRSGTNFILVDHPFENEDRVESKEQNNIGDGYDGRQSFHAGSYNNIDYNAGGYSNNNGYNNYNNRDLYNSRDNFSNRENFNHRDHLNARDGFHNRDGFDNRDNFYYHGNAIKRDDEEMGSFYHKPEPPRIEAPKVETPRTEASKIETPNAEIPKAQTFQAQTLKNDIPKTEVPRVESSRQQSQKYEAKSSSGMGFAKVAILLIVSCAILGLSLGFGYKWGESYFAGKSPTQNILGSESGVDGANVISSGSSTNSEEVGQSGMSKSDIAKAINNPLNGSESLANIAENTKKAVVAITSHEITRNYIMGEVEVPTSGTGIVYQMSADKIYIVTNSHVVGEGETSVKFEHQNEPVDVEFIGRDEVTDVAVLSVNKSDVNAEALAYIKPIKFADSDKVRVGDFVMVVGNPLGYDYTTTFGIVSGLNRNTQLTSEDLLIQVDAAVNRGNSGGPLVNMAGELIGVINQKMNTLTAEGIGFAIPANRVMEDIKFLVENKENPTTSQAFLGITGEAIDESASEYYKLPLGVLVRSTLKGAGAEASGIKEGDIIIEVDGKKITNMVELQRIVSRKKPNEEIDVKVFRVQDGEIIIKVKLSDKSKFKLNRE